MKSYVPVLAVGILLSMPTLASDASPSLGGVSVGQSRAQVEAILGKPVKVISTGDALDPEMRYAGITVWLWDQSHVAQIRSTDKKYCLSKGLCPGSGRREFDKLLGRPIAQEGGVIHYSVNAETCRIEAAFKGSVAAMLAIKCQP